MYKKTAKQNNIPAWKIFVLILEILIILFWCGYYMYGVSVFTEAQKVKLPISANISHDNNVISAVSESIGVPVRISIPSIDLSAEIEEVTLASDGSMDVPNNPHDVVWYAVGPRPGEIGSAAIAGHVDWLNGATAVFANLNKVKSGDEIIIQDEKGLEILFVAREIRKYSATADATDVFISKDGIARLNIITCSGVWDKRTEQYSERLVVFTEKKAD